jgi:hypothetical protein
LTAWSLLSCWRSSNPKPNSLEALELLFDASGITTPKVTLYTTSPSGHVIVKAFY